MTAPHVQRPPAMVPPEGPALGSLGPYRLLRRLAVGGMAELFLAQVDGPGGFEKLVVIKRLMPEHAGNPVMVRMFLDEARLLARLDHPHITQVHAVVSQGGGHHFAMEYVHGEDLRGLMRAAAAAGMRVPDGIAVAILAEVASALHFAHERCDERGVPLGIVHRDVSPSNVLVSYHGTVKIADFGVAKWALQQTETRHGTLKGKLAYMSPEQARGEAVDRRTDVFALGILLYELTTGTRLFQGATDLAVLKQVSACQVTPPTRRRPDYPPALARIVERALARAPDERFESAQALAGELQGFLTSCREPHDVAARAGLMEQLFARRLSDWQRAEGEGQTLGEHLAALPAAEVGSGFAPDEPADSEGDEVTRPDAASVPRPGGRDRRTARGPALWGGIALVSSLLVLAGNWLWLRAEGDPDSTRAAVAPPTRPVPRAAPVIVPKAAADPPATDVVTPVVVKADERGRRSARKPARTRKRVRRARASAPPPGPATATPGSPAGVRVWDPDSVLLPK